jgi:hypothetical protein
LSCRWWKRQNLNHQGHKGTQRREVEIDFDG